MRQQVQELLTYSAGPYKGYLGRAEYDRDAGLFHGEVLGTKDVITFQAEAPAELGKAFVESVDDYLAFCRSRREAPEKPFSGRFVARIAPDLHRKLSLAAQEQGTSLNALVEQSLASSLATEPAESKRKAKANPRTRRRPRKRAG
jgi:predicted HicB family RNase H-like nuclease